MMFFRTYQCRRSLLAVPLSLVLWSETAHSQKWLLSANPVTSIGDADSDSVYSLHQVVNVRQMSDGRIVVTMGPDIRFFDASGKYLAAAGGRGRGPGEFQHIQDLIVLPGDTLLALNIRERVWLSPQGKYLRRESLEFGALSKDGWFSEGAVFLPNGDLLASQYRSGTSRTRELHRPVLRYSLYRPGIDSALPLVEVAGLRQLAFGEHGNAVQPFSPHAQSAIGRDRVYAGDNDTTFISVFDFDGKPQGRITVADRAVAVTRADLDRYRARMLEFAGVNEERKRRAEEGWAIVPKPRRHPYWGRAMVDELGYLWVSSPQSGSNPVLWTVFDRNGKRTAAITMPKGFQPKEIRSNFVLGVALDDDDVEYVSMYRLDRGAR